MLTKIKKMFVLVMLAAFVFALTGCGGGIKGALDSLYVEAEVTEGFALPTAQLEGAVTTWSSNNEAIVIDDLYADVVRPSVSDVEVTLTATVTLGEKTESKDFVVIVKCLLAPDAININVGGLKAVEGKADTYYIVKDKEVQFTIEVADEEMSTDVKWSATNSRVSVENGLVKAKEDGSYSILPDQLVGTAYYNGMYDPQTDQVWFRISEHIQDLVLAAKRTETDPTYEFEDYGLFIYTYSGAFNAKRWVFNGPNSPDTANRVKLEIIYSTIDD